MDYSADLDALFRLPLAEFTGARNALASRLSKSGQKEAAERVRALTKPPVSAWVVNQLFWRERAWFDRLISSGAQLRQAQASGLVGQVANIHEPLKAQREALNELSRQAVVFLSQDGHSLSPDTLRRVTQDLQGLAASASLPDGPDLGRLTDDIDAPGFEALAALVPRSTDGPSRGPAGASRVLSFAPGGRQATGGDVRSQVKGQTSAQREDLRRQQERALATAAKRAVREAEKAVASARHEADKAEAAMKAAAAQVKEAERERVRAESALEKASAAADAARQSARRAASGAAEAAQALDDAERTLTHARAQTTE